MNATERKLSPSSGSRKIEDLFLSQSKTSFPDYVNCDRWIYLLSSLSRPQPHPVARQSSRRLGARGTSVAMSWFYMAMQREPVVMWSCFIGALGAYPRLTARPSPDP